MEHGRIIKVDDWGMGYSTYITVKYGDKYLWLNINDLNRREEFADSMKDKYKDLGVNILDLSVSDLMEFYIEENDKEPLPEEEVPHYFTKGAVLRNKANGKLYIMIVAKNLEENKHKYYMLDIETFELSPTHLNAEWGKEGNTARQFVIENYDMYNAYFHQLKLRFK